MHLTSTRGRQPGAYARGSLRLPGPPEAWQYLPLAARLTRYWSHRRFQELLGGSEVEKIVFRTHCRFNDRSAIERHMRRAGCERVELECLESRPWALRFSPLLTRWAVSYHRMLIRSKRLQALRTTIIGVYRKATSASGITSAHGAYHVRSCALKGMGVSPCSQGILDDSVGIAWSGPRCCCLT